MNARELTKALGGRWHGSYGMTRCPAHEDRTPSLSVSDGNNGKLLTNCHAGCAPKAVWAALQDRGFVPRGNDRSRTRFSRRRKHSSTKPRPNQGHAIEIWRAARLAPSTPVEGYLRGRGIMLPVPPTLRYNPAVKYTPSGLWLPCMVAAVQGADQKIAAIHRTYIRDDGQGKAGVSSPKMALGPISSGAVRLGSAEPVLGIAEGVETGLSAMQIFCLPVWCSLSASRLDRVWLPPEAREVHIFADNGTAGHEAAERAATAYQAQGRRVVLRFPPAQFGDFNDALCAGAAA